MPVGVVEIYATATVVVVDFPGSLVIRVGVVGEAGFPEPRKGRIEFVLVEQESVVLGLDILGVCVVQGDPIADLKRYERTPLLADRKVEDSGEKSRNR